MAKTTEVATAGNGAVAVQNSDYGELAGAGLEGTRVAEQTVSFLRMLQGLSPQLDEGQGSKYIPGAKLGQILDNGTNEVFDGRVGVDVMICFKSYNYGVWIPRDLGSGFRGTLSPDDPLIVETMQRMAKKYGDSARFKFPRYKERQWSDTPPIFGPTGEEVELIETGQLGVRYAPAGQLAVDTAEPAIVACTSTSLPTYTGWLKRHMRWKYPHTTGRFAGTMQPAPLFNYVWRLSTADSENKNGQKFKIWKLTLVVDGEPTEPVDAATAKRAQIFDLDSGEQPSPLFVAGWEFYKEFSTGRLDAAIAKASEQADVDSGGDNDPPF